ncbi:uncharacterized protein LOC135472412 [Liolophura sinensis]|uniref:uncharacterized protein LOC135472412 n=1 Tax=Liolophura sinensis TaxID=3198878 RepID=UPI0031580531
MSANPKDLISLSRGDGTSAVVHLHGATLLSWKCKGQEMLFVSKEAVFDNKKAIRGGIPIVFPNFGPWKHGPQHGFARIKRWDVEHEPGRDVNGNPTVSFSLCDDEGTRNMWNMKFKLVYTIVLEADSIKLTLTVENTDSIIYDFTCLLHTYLATPDVTQTKIEGLEGLSYIDKLQNGEKCTEERKIVKITEGYDRIYKNAPSEITVSGLDCKSSVKINTKLFSDIVLWNPWEKASGMSDFGDEEYQTMLCVEPGYLYKTQEIHPRQVFTFNLTMTRVQ